MDIGTVYRSTGSWYKVVTDKKILNCRIQGKFRLKLINSTNPVVVGDRVEVKEDISLGKNYGTITKILSRENYIVRRSVNLSKETHIIAANIDHLFLLITYNNPKTYSKFIDRILVTAEAYKIKVTLVFNKIDTYDQYAKIYINNLINIYNKAGYSCIKISALKKINIEKINELIRDNTCMFFGNSGVGKSTLINALSPKLNLKTSEISIQNKQGVHTTTFAEMFDLENGGKLIDTPGIKGFGIIYIEREEIKKYFPEFKLIANDCKFKNCIHLNEPDCNVKKAVESKKISSSRYQNYLELLLDNEKNRNA